MQNFDERFLSFFILAMFIPVSSVAIILGFI